MAWTRGSPAGAGSRTSSEVTRLGSATIRQGGRDKAYRPLPEADRRTALVAATAAWERGDWFEAHELLEPAWMGADDAVERDLYQGLIKLAAAYVHRARGNGMGLARNLAGSATVLGRVADDHRYTLGIDVASLLADVTRRMPAGDGPADLAFEPPTIPTTEER